MSKAPPQSRTITPAEVREWFKHCRKPRPSDALCSDVARQLTKFRWPGDPPDAPASPWLPKEEIDTDQWWDFKGATDAANRLLASVPAMLAHWDGLRWAPETRAGYEAIKAFGDALSIALPYIEWPFGKYERQTPHNRPRPKEWHLPAVLIASIIVKALIQTGHAAPGLTHNSVVVGIVRNVLVRMNYQNMEMVTRGAIGAHLTRWATKFGRVT